MHRPKHRRNQAASRTTFAPRLEAIRSISPIWGVDLHDIAITGDGVIDGQGEAWRPVKKFKMTESQWAQLVSSGGVVDERHQIWWPTKAAIRRGRFPIVKPMSVSSVGVSYAA